MWSSCHAVSHFLKVYFPQKNIWGRVFSSQSRENNFFSYKKLLYFHLLEMSIRLILRTLSVWLVPLERGFLGALRAFRTFPHPGFDSWAKVRSPDCFLSRNLHIEENFEEKFEYSLFFQELDILSLSLHVKPSSWQITKTWRSLSISSLIYDQFVPVCWKTLPPKAGTVNVEVELYKLVKSFQTWWCLLSPEDKPQRAIDLNLAPNIGRFWWLYQYLDINIPNLKLAL